jgi:hypothetical protein
MATRDGFDPAHPLPLFLDDPYEPQGIGTARDGAVTWSRVIKASILIAAAAAIGIAVLSGNPVALVADVTASLVDSLGLQPRTAPSTPTLQATADAQVSPPAAQDTPTRDEIAASEPAGQDQTEKSEPPTDALFRQFQAWAADKDAQADVVLVQPVQDAPAKAVQNGPAQDAPAQAVENDRVPLRIMREHPLVQPAHSARAEMRVQNPRKKIRRTQNAQVAPAQDARAQAARAPDQSAPNAQAPSFLQAFGVRN